MTRELDISPILIYLKEASLFELYRLNLLISHEMGNSQRIREVGNSFSEGDQITYLDAVSNNLIKAIVVIKKPKRVLVHHCHDGKKVEIPYYMIDYNSRTLRFNMFGTQLDKNTLKVGEMVGYSWQGKEYVGIVRRLNQKTASIDAKDFKCRVSYGLLYRVMEGEHAEMPDPYLLNP